MAHMHNTFIKKRLVENARQSAYSKYKSIADGALASGMPKETVIAELEAEADRIRNDDRDGDHLFQQGLRNARESSLEDIATLIQEIKKGESE